MRFVTLTLGSLAALAMAYDGISMPRWIYLRQYKDSAVASGATGTGGYAAAARGPTAAYGNTATAIGTAATSSTAAASVTAASGGTDAANATAVAYSTTTPNGTVTASVAPFTTLTVLTTSVRTITSCAANVTKCPAEPSALSSLPAGALSTILVTDVVALTTTVCPVAAAASISSSLVSLARTSGIKGETLSASPVLTARPVLTPLYVGSVTAGLTATDSGAAEGTTTTIASYASKITKVFTLTMTLGSGTSAHVVATTIRTATYSTIYITSVVNASPSRGGGLPSFNSHSANPLSLGVDGSSAIAVSASANTAAAVPSSYNEGGSSTVPATSAGTSTVAPAPLSSYRESSANPVASTGASAAAVVTGAGIESECTCEPALTITMPAEIATVTVTVTSSVPVSETEGNGPTGVATTIGADGVVGPGSPQMTANAKATGSPMPYHFSNETTVAFRTGMGTGVGASATGSARHTRRIGRITRNKSAATYATLLPTPLED